MALSPEERSERSRKAAATRRANREAAARREESNSSQNWNWLPWVLLGMVILGMLIWHPWTLSTAAPVVTPVVTATPATLGAGSIDPVATATPTALPLPVSCKTPSIQASLDGSSFKEWGVFLDTTLGKRMTYTSRSLLVPEKAWNVPLTATELKTVEQTWQFMQVCVPEGTFGRVFAGGFEQGLNRYENGVLMTLQPGVYEFRLRNGEIVLWYPDQETFASKDLDRIVLQIRNGNFDIKSPLAFFGVTTDLLSKIPDDLVKERNVQIVPPVDPTLAQ